MKVIKEKINEERIKSAKLREYAFDQKFEVSQRIRKEQQKHWDKFNWLKKLNDAIEKERKKEKYVI